MSIFISYRRDGGADAANEIYKNLKRDYDIFLDTESQKNGRFDTAIIEKVTSCTDFIILITGTVFDRCSEPDDWILKEAQTAIREGKNIIPVFVGVNGFPDNVPESIDIILNYNAVTWNDKRRPFKKLKSFLISNRRYVLSVIRDEDRICLSPSSKEGLKELYRRFVEFGRLPAEIQFHLQDVEDLASLSVREDIVKEHGLKTAESVAVQSVLGKEKWFSAAITTAVEYMLQDEILDACAAMLQQVFIDKYGAQSCSFSRKNGFVAYYWTPFLWVEIIEELLKGLVKERAFDYANSKDFLSIDCFVKARNGKTIWSFVSFVPQMPNDEKYEKFIELIRIPGIWADYFDIPDSALAFHIYPDFYLNIGLLKDNKINQSFDAVNSNKDVFNLMHYNFGLH